MKKLFLTMILLFSFLLPLANSVNANDNANPELKSTVLQWQLLSKQQAKANYWKPLNCQADNIQSYIELSTFDPEKYNANIEALKNWSTATRDPGLVKDIKGCVLERQMNSIVQWLVYIAIIWFIIWAVIIVGTSVLWGSGKSNWGWDPMGWGMPWEQWGWGNNNLINQLKTPVIGIVILVLLTLWILNVILRLISWVFDSLF